MQNRNGITHWPLCSLSMEIALNWNRHWWELEMQADLAVHEPHQLPELPALGSC